MSLTRLIKKGSLRGPATATPATFATREPSRQPTVATVATVAVAKASDRPANDTAQRAVTVDPDRHCWPHSAAMNTAEIDRFKARLARFTDRGVIQGDAECLADRIVSKTTGRCV